MSAAVVAALEGALGGIRLQDPRLALEALTHPSFAHESGDGAHYERLEFLGDAAINLIAAELVFAAHPGDDEGRLSRRRAALVCGEHLARLAGELGLGALLRRGVGEARQPPSARVLAATVEAVAGVLFLQDGLAGVASVLGARFAAAMGAGVPASDAKSALQEHCHRAGLPPPCYRAVPDSPEAKAGGPFAVEVAVGGRVFAGHASRRRAAEQVAAGVALAQWAVAASPVAP